MNNPEFIQDWLPLYENKNNKCFLYASIYTISITITPNVIIRNQYSNPGASILKI